MRISTKKQRTLLVDKHRGSKMIFSPDDVMDGNNSVSSSSTTTEDLGSSYHLEEDTHRNERREIERLSSKETGRVKIWRAVVTFALLATGVTVTLVTYRRLVQQERENFETACEQFSRTVAVAAAEQQKNIRKAYSTFGDAITSYADTTSASWPFFTLPKFEHHAENARAQGNLEILTVMNYVEPHQKDAYIDYTASQYQNWVHEGHMHIYGNMDRLNPVGFQDRITRRNPEGIVEDIDRDYYFPMWTFSPPPTTYGFINWNPPSLPDIGSVFEDLLVLKNDTLITPVRPYAGVPLVFTEEQHEVMHSKLADSSSDHPHSFAYRLIHKDADDDDSPVVGAVGGAFAWDASLRFLLPEGVDGIVAILSNDCNQTFTYLLNGPDALFMGEGDQHDLKYDGMRTFVNLALHANPAAATSGGHCQYSMEIYPSAEFESKYITDTPKDFAFVVAITFAFVVIVFFVYDLMVQQRNNKLLDSNALSNEIVSSLFPGQIRNKLLGISMEAEGKHTETNPHKSLKNFLVKGDIEAGNGGKGTDQPPLADLFLNTSVLFADISGFTAWSSMREPSQVFVLLETLFSSFDKSAKRRGIFKIETVGDCYVAAAGLPTPREDHAIAIARFADHILGDFGKQTKKLERKLGHTGDLGLRIGIHSGPVTGGVMRGDRARFQLFGDTMNVASRIESTGEKGKIHLSDETAKLLIEHGRENWIQKRQEKVMIKGKALVETYWLTNTRTTRRTTTSSVSSEIANIRDLSTHEDDEIINISANSKGLNETCSRLVTWNVEILSDLLKQVVAARLSRKQQKTQRLSRVVDVDGKSFGTNYLEEVKEIIELPEFNNNKKKQQKEVDPSSVILSNVVMSELTEYVSMIATMYNANPFHNFEHASHVVMSVTKLLSRIVAPKTNMEDGTSSSYLAANLHDHTYGITSDPLTQFACAFSALIHDVDHSGVSNAQLVKENSPEVALFGDRSVAEQNSLHLAWDLLFDDNKYKNFRRCLLSTKTEVNRFRALVVNSVMATDIVDKDLKELRNGRWEKAFHNNTKEDNNTTTQTSGDNDKIESRDAVNRKATIVIEHIIQASDVCHTMQHWHVYRKWNERLFFELYTAYKCGRMEANPATFWAKGEIGFFDYYIIPLAKKLKECGVFGVSSGEFLDYAMKNRTEWLAEGETIVAEMIEKYSKLQYDKKIDSIPE